MKVVHLKYIAAIFSVCLLGDVSYAQTPLPAATGTAAIPLTAKEIAAANQINKNVSITFGALQIELQNIPDQPYAYSKANRDFEAKVSKESASVSIASTPDVATSAPALPHQHYSAEVGIDCKLQKNKKISRGIIRIGCDNPVLGLKDQRLLATKGPMCNCLTPSEKYCEEEGVRLEKIRSELPQRLGPAFPCYECNVVCDTYPDLSYLWGSCADGL